MFRDRATADDVYAALTQQGMQDVRVWTGDEVLARHNGFMDQRNVLQRIGENFGADEKTALQDYLDAAEDGYFFLTVHAPSDAEVNGVRSVLMNNNARLMHYYGRTGMADLSEQGAVPPQTTPTTGKVHEPSGPPPAAPGDNQRDPAW